LADKNKTSEKKEYCLTLEKQIQERLEASLTVLPESELLEISLNLRKRNVTQKESGL
jgi:hypothetical protein